MSAAEKEALIAVDEEALIAVDEEALIAARVAANKEDVIFRGPGSAMLGMAVFAKITNAKGLKDLADSRIYESEDPDETWQDRRARASAKLRRQVEDERVAKVVELVQIAVHSLRCDHMGELLTMRGESQALIRDYHRGEFAHHMLRSLMDYIYQNIEHAQLILLALRRSANFRPIICRPRIGCFALGGTKTWRRIRNLTQNFAGQTVAGREAFLNTRHKNVTAYDKVIALREKMTSATEVGELAEFYSTVGSFAIYLRMQARVGAVVSPRQICYLQERLRRRALELIMASLVVPGGNYVQVAGVRARSEQGMFTHPGMRKLYNLFAAQDEKGLQLARVIFTVLKQGEFRNVLRRPQRGLVFCTKTWGMFRDANRRVCRTMRNQAAVRPV